LETVYSDFYQFAEIAVDTAALPQSNVIGWPVFLKNVDIIGGLRSLASEYKAHGADTVPALPLVRRINSLVTRLREAHQNQTLKTVSAECSKAMWSV
jgi:hypothetical protein